MANLSLLYWAAHHSDDGSYRLAAQAHAQMTAKRFVRADDSTYHAVEYDVNTGARLRGYTFQGAHDESLWSRGQGWAIYGYVRSFRESGKREYLALAERLAEHYCARLGERQVPPWDFDAQDADARIKDTAAASIVSSALLDLGRLHPDEAAGARWYQRGMAMLEALCRDEFNYDAARHGLLGNSCYSRPHNEGVAGATMFGDFYFCEALASVTLPGKLRPALTRMPASIEVD